MSQSESPAPDVRPIRRLIRRTARLLRSSWVATGLGLTLGLGLGTLASAALLDLAIPLLPALRLLALGLVVVPATWALATGVVRPLFRKLHAVHVARRIEAHLPGIHNRLVSCIDLEEGTKQVRPSPEFHRRLIQEAVERIRGFRASKVVDGRSLCRALLFATASALAFGAGLGLFSDRLPTALARIFSPLADIPPASGVVYHVEPGDIKVLRGDDVTFLARVQRGEPEALRLEIEPDGKGKALAYDLEKIEPRLWRFTLSGFESSFHYRVRGGGTWTTRKRITVVERHSIVGLSTLLHHPEYMGIDEPIQGPPQVADVSGPVGSTVDITVEAQGDVATGEIQFLKKRPVRIAVSERLERIWFQERLPQGAGPEGRWDWDFRLLARPAHTEPPAPGVHWHRFSGAEKPMEVRAGDSLFALVYLDPKARPRSIMLSWHDGKDWEHRAYWGDDQIGEGRDGTVSRLRVGPLPRAGEWVRLEVAASDLGLESKAVRGMGFSVADGQCFWHRAGTLPAAYLRSDELYVERVVPMQPAGANLWKGSFPLEQDELYRVELRNELGHASKPMKEARAAAVVDHPPQIVLERPGGDVVLSKPVKLPLSIAAYDDFGLADLVVSVQKGDRGGFIGRPIHHFDRPRKSSTHAASLDVAAHALKPGEFLRYRVEARDRKGQSAQTQEFVVRLADDGDAADKQLENFDSNQAEVRQRLDHLIEAQSKVQVEVRKLESEHPDLKEQAGSDAAELAAVRRESGRLAGLEEQHAGLAEQLAGTLKQAADQAAELKMIPSELLRQLEGVEKAFRAGAVQPLHEAAADLRRGADANAPTPDLPALRQDTDRIQQQLEAVREQLDAAARARKDVTQDAQAAVEALRENALRASAGLTQHELHDLQQAIRDRDGRLKAVEGPQKDLAAATPEAAELLLPDLERRQGELEPREDRALNDARALLEAARMEPLRSAEGDAPAADKAKSRSPARSKSSADHRPGKGNQPRRAALEARLNERIEALGQARAALGKEDRSLDQILGQLDQQLRPGQAGHAEPGLERLLRSNELRRALEMARRSRQLAQARRDPNRPAAPTDRPDQFPTTDKMVAPLDADLPELDPTTRRLIMKLQPQLREDLLQGLREEGPEGYKAFIRTYFKKLSQVKGSR
jgi:hypothetical protein